MRHYVFEDNAASLLHQLYRAAYPREVIESFQTACRLLAGNLSVW